MMFLFFLKIFFSLQILFKYTFLAADKFWLSPYAVPLLKVFLRLPKGMVLTPCQSSTSARPESYYSRIFITNIAAFSL